MSALTSGYCQNFTWRTGRSGVPGDHQVNGQLKCIEQRFLFLQFYCIHCFVPGLLILRLRPMWSIPILLWYFDFWNHRLLNFCSLSDFTFSDSSLPSYSLRNVSIFTSSSGDFTFTSSMSPLYLLSSQNFSLSFQFLLQDVPKHSD